MRNQVGFYSRFNCTPEEMANTFLGEVLRDGCKVIVTSQWHPEVIRHLDDLVATGILQRDNVLLGIRYRNPARTDIPV